MNSKTKYVPGYSWDSINGKRTIIGQAEGRPEGWLAIGCGGSTTLYYTHVNDMAREEAYDIERYERHLADLERQRQVEVQMLEAANKRTASWNGYCADLPPMRREKIWQTLEKLIRCSGEVMTRKVFIERLCAQGEKLNISYVDRIKDMSRMAFFRANNEQQRAYEKRQKEAGKKPEYEIGPYIITKTEYDYAVWLTSR